MKKNIIAMWSGPRNLSTAMMRSFENRQDVIKVIDEPFYGAYLKKFNKNHPLKQDVINSMETNYKEVENFCKKESVDGYVYQKHMSQHIYDFDSLEWTFNSINCFLIRDPDLVTASFLNKWNDANPMDLGYRQQLEIFNLISNLNGVCPVVDASILLDNPEHVLKKLCLTIGIPWDSRMLSWESGLRDSDGIWAKHWYPSVMTTTGFTRNTTKSIKLTKDAKKISDELRPYYDAMMKFVIS